MRRTPARRVEPELALWRGFLSSGSSGNGFVISLSCLRRIVQLSHIIQRIKPARKLATTYMVWRIPGAAGMGSRAALVPTNTLAAGTGAALIACKPSFGEAGYETMTGF